MINKDDIKYMQHMGHFEASYEGVTICTGDTLRECENDIDEMSESEIDEIITKRKKCKTIE